MYCSSFVVVQLMLGCKAYGELQPISENDEQNRRVEVAIFANKKMKKAADKGQL